MVLKNVYSQTQTVHSMLADVLCQSTMSNIMLVMQAALLACPFPFTIFHLKALFNHKQIGNYLLQSAIGAHGALQTCEGTGCCPEELAVGFRQIQ